MNDESDRIWEEAVMAYFQVLLPYSSSRSENAAKKSVNMHSPNACKIH
jgi:hypothetical protein